MPKTSSAFLLCALMAATRAAPAISQELCKPTLSSSASRHSDPVKFQRTWTAVFEVDASECATGTGPFTIEFVRLKEVGPDLTFWQGYTWRAGETEVSLDLTWDEWVSAYRIAAVQPCPCRR